MSNVFSALFGIVRGRGLVSTIREEDRAGLRPRRGVAGFLLAATAAAIAGAALYGFATGAGLGMEVASNDALKGGSMAVLAISFSLSVFLLAYRLLGREEAFVEIAAVPLTFSAVAGLVLALSAPLVFLLGVLAGPSPDVVYVHVVVLNAAALLGLYVAGALVLHSARTERSQLIAPNAAGFLLTLVALVVLALFFRPFLSPWPSFSVGTDRLKDRLGIGVGEQVRRALEAAATAQRLSYRFQTTNANGDLEQDYVVTRVGDDYVIEVLLHALPGEVLQKGKRIWLLDGTCYTALAQGPVVETSSAALNVFLCSSLPEEAFGWPRQAFAQASWRAVETEEGYTAVGVNPRRRQLTVQLSKGDRRLVRLALSSAEPGPSAGTWVSGVKPGELDRAALEADLHRAMVTGAVDRSDASMHPYIQPETFFAVCYPRTWYAGPWDAARRSVRFTAPCPAEGRCAWLEVRVFDLAEDKGALQYAEDLEKSLELQPGYREVYHGLDAVDNTEVGLVSYLYDEAVRGQMLTTEHVEYIFVGEAYRYHLDFSAPEADWDSYDGLFKVMASCFACLAR